MEMIYVSEGEYPKYLLYARLNCETSEYPTLNAISFTGRFSNASERAFFIRIAVNLLKGVELYFLLKSFLKYISLIKHAFAISEAFKSGLK